MMASRRNSRLMPGVAQHHSRNITSRQSNNCINRSARSEFRMVIGAGRDVRSSQPLGRHGGRSLKGGWADIPVIVCSLFDREKTRYSLALSRGRPDTL
jgi:hypothetical protein